MPQKKNPFALTAIRSLANEIVGVQTMLANLARTPSGQPDNRLTVYSLLPDYMQNLNHANVLMAEVIKKMRYQTERGVALVQNSWAMASDLAEMLVKQGALNFREAHKLIGYLSGFYSIQQLTLELLQQTSLQILQKPLVLDAETFNQSLNPWLAVQQRQETGGAAPNVVDDMINELNNSLSLYETQAHHWQQQIEMTETKLLQLAYSME